MKLSEDRQILVDELIKQTEDKLTEIFGTIATISVRVHKKTVSESARYDLVFQAIEEVTGVTKYLLQSKKRHRAITDMRHLFMYLCREFTVLGIELIGRHVNRGHCDVIHATRKVKSLLYSDPQFKKIHQEVVNRILELIKEKATSN